MAVSTDSFVVSPPFFPGGNIGDLAVNGTVNDLAMCGAKPLFITLGLILEEGFLLKELWEILTTVRRRADEVGVKVIAGDIKVVERGKGDGIFINTTGIGKVMEGVEISPERVKVGDRIILNGPIGEHGIAVMSLREGLMFETPLRSDTMPLWPLVRAVLEEGGRGVHMLRDATRGGVATVLNEIAMATDLGIVIHEESIPVKEEVRGACEILGLDPLYVANEGRFLAFVSPEVTDRVLNALRGIPGGEEAEVIGEVVEEHPKTVVMRTWMGGTRVVDMLSGEQLPRIC
jgi:hydrogenase expression/formation protein HypE